MLRHLSSVFKKKLHLREKIECENEEDESRIMLMTSMEKYTVDLDKVLDDFEETEALQIDDGHRNTNASLLQSSNLISHNHENQYLKNGTRTSLEDITKVSESARKSNEYSLCSDDDLLPHNPVNDDSSKHFGLPDGCDLENRSFIENGLEIPDISFIGQSDISNRCLSLPASENSNAAEDSENSYHFGNVISANCVSNLKLTNEHDCQEKIKSVPGTFSESHIIKEEKVINPLNIWCNSEKIVEKSHDLHLIHSKFDNVTNLQNFEKNNQNQSVLQPEELCDSQQKVPENVISQLSDDTFSKVHENVIDDLSAHKSIPESIGSIDETSTVAESNATMHNEVCKSSHEEQQPVQNNLAPESDSTGQENMELDNEDSIRPQPVQDINRQHEYEPILDENANDDDDSGVSCEEGNNSPIFFFNNQIINSNDNSNEEAERAIDGSSSFQCHKIDGKEVDVNGETTVSVMNPCVLENDESISEIHSFDETALSENVVNAEVSNKYTGARPKLDGQVSQEVDNLYNAEIEEQSTLKDRDIKDDCLNNNELVAHCDEIEVKAERSQCDDCDISEKSDLVPVNTLCNLETDASHSNSTAEGYENDKPDNIESVPSSADTECTVSMSDAKNDNFHQRLPRPTTLDLPSRNLAVSQVSGESGVNMSDNDNSNVQSDLATDFIPSESSVVLDDSASEPSPRQEPKIGLVKPFWIPDAEAPNCMHCGIKFTVIKRRHHCRACGKVLCSRCCNLRAKLAYLNKEDRICHQCYEILNSTSQNEDAPASMADSQSSSSCGSSPNFSPSPQISNPNFGDKNTWRPHPNNPDDYCSTIPPLQQIQLTGPRPPPTVMVPIGVLKRGNKPRREPKQVIFSDGIRPGGDLTDLTEPADVIPAYRRMGRKRIEKAMSGDTLNTIGSPVSFNTSQRSKQKKFLVSDEEGPLPPVVLQIDNEKAKDEKLNWDQLVEKMQDDEQKPVNFALSKNVHLFVKLTKLDCCFGKECWCFASCGLCAVGQDEIMVILERTPGENTLPRGIIRLFTQIYDSASKGTTFEDLGHIIFPEQILGSSDHRGFLFVRPTFQCLSKLVVPNTPFLVAILIHKWEVPWAKVFPLRLMLRLGAECRYYPCSLVSVRHRKPVFFEIGQTIMSVLSDLRNYQFTIPVIPGLVVHMEEKKTCVNIPRNRYEKVMKILNNNNVEYVLALGSNFSSEADSHLVCMQKEEGDYQTQAINIENTARRVTGASFIVFSGALKSSSGLSAKFSIVEDGLLVQIPQETMVNLHMALRDMKDMTVECGQINAPEPEELVIIQWTRDDKKFNIGVRSPIDYRSLEGIPSLRIHTSTDYAGENYLIRWTEVFFLEVDGSSNNSSIQHEMVDPCRLAETIAQSCCMALAPYLDQLAESELTKIGLRVTLDSERDRMEYDIGARGKPLPAVYMNALDCGLIPVILRLSSSAQSEPISFELIFYILVK